MEPIEEKLLVWLRGLAPKDQDRALDELLRVMAKILEERHGHPGGPLSKFPKLYPSDPMQNHE